MASLITDVSFSNYLSKNNEINKQIKKETPTPTTAIE